MFCPQPFTMAEVYENGLVYTCCADFINFYSIGNIYESSFDEIWNGDKAVALRQKMLDSDLSICKDICHRKFVREQKTDEYSLIMKKFPTEISVSSDNSCNVACKFCRDEIMSSKFDEKNVKTEIEKNWLPMFKDAKIVRFGCTGEPFSSKKEIMLIKAIANKYPDVRFFFHTNGILPDERMLKNIGVYNKIHSFTVSIHAGTEKTYKSVVKGGNYRRLQNNLKLYSKMKKNNLIQDFRLVFVVISENYKEMPAFAQMAKNLGATVDFWLYRQNGTKFGQDSANFDLTNKNHPEHQNLINVLNNPLLSEQHVRLYPELVALKNSFIET